MPWLWGKSAPKDTGTLWVIPSRASTRTRPGSSSSSSASRSTARSRCGRAACSRPPTRRRSSRRSSTSRPYFGGARPFEVIGDRSIPNFYFYDWQRTEKIIGDEIDTMLKARKTPRRRGTTPRRGWSRSSGAESRPAAREGAAAGPGGSLTLARELARALGPAAARPYLFIAPFFLMFVVFWVGPIVTSIGISLTNWTCSCPGSSASPTIASFSAAPSSTSPSRTRSSPRWSTTC